MNPNHHCSFSIRSIESKFILFVANFSEVECGDEVVTFDFYYFVFFFWILLLQILLKMDEFRTMFTYFEVDSVDDDVVIFLVVVDFCVGDGSFRG